MKLFLILTIILIKSIALACEVDLHKFIYKVDDSLDNGIFKKSTCPPLVNKKIVSFLEGISGRVSNRIINYQVDLKDVVITPQVAHIINIKDLANESIELGEDKIIQNLKSLTKIKQISSDTSLTFTVVCDSCHSKLGNTNLKLILDEKTFWMTGDVLKKSLVWVANSKINLFSKDLSPDLFEQKIVYLDKDIDLFQDITKIRFYQTTKSLNEGDILTVNHVTPMRLVRAFDKVKLKVLGSSLALSTTAKARKSGFLDEFIEVVNLKSNKKFLAKVIDFNTVEIEL